MIEKESVQSVAIQMSVNGNTLSTGTAFFVESARGPVLITNRHNVTGRRQDNNQPLSPTGGIPDTIEIGGNVRDRLGTWRFFSFPLYDASGERRWLEHPKLHGNADFVGLPLSLPSDIEPYPYSLEPPRQPLAVGPSEVVSVIGFPFGLAAGGLFGVWVSGFLASEMVVDYNSLPLFLVDCRSRPGQSGSPVVAKRNGYLRFADGAVAMGGNASDFLGIYSGRIHEQSDLGLVWKRSAIKELVDTIV